MSFCGVVHSGVITDERLSLIVSHPHPDNDFGGGPGPVDSWREPYDEDVYRAQVDDDFDADDARFEVRDYAHVASFTAGAWSLDELDAAGSLSALTTTPGGLAGLVSYGGSAYALWLKEGTECRELPFAGMPAGLLRVVGAHHQAGRSVVVAGVRSRADDAASDLGLLELEEAQVVWRSSLPVIPEPVSVLAVGTSARGERVIAAAGRRLWLQRGEAFEWVHDAGAEVSFLSLDRGALLAGTVRGDVLAGEGNGVRLVARVGPVQSVARWQNALFITDQDRVYRVLDGETGPTTVLVPRQSAVGDWPAAGHLVVGANALWLLGSHDLYRSTDGTSWTAVDIEHPLSER